MVETEGGRSLNFEDEPFVRVYKRRTTTMAVVGWEARAVLRELFMVVDRAGVLDLDDEDPAEAVTAVLGDVPIDVVRAALERLTKKECVKINGRFLVIPRFREAQECAMSDALRQRESRARRRDDAMKTVTNCDAPETIRDATVTIGHDESHAVTQNITEQNITEHEVLVGPPPKSASRPPRRAPEVPVQMPADWKPSDALAAALAEKYQTTPERIQSCVAEFRFYWTDGKGAGTRRGAKGWGATFSNRIKAMAERGELYVGPQNARTFEPRRGQTPPQPNSGYAPRQL